MINIKEPCNENWDEFSPTEKGAFCGKCQIDVIDFSVQTNDEIKMFFSDHAVQSMCGRFKQSQIDSLNIDFYNWDGQSRQTFQAKFILTLLIVFGLSLFSHSTTNSSRNNNTILSACTDPDSTLNVTTDSSQLVSLPHDSLLNEIVPTLVTNDIDFPVLQEVITMGGFDGGPDILPNILENEITIDWELIEPITTMGICAPPKQENIEIKINPNAVIGLWKHNNS